MTARITAIRGVASTAVTHAVAIGTTFFVTPILFRGLGAERYGIWSIVVALTGYYGLVNMGIGKANTKYIAQFHAVGDDEAVRRFVSTGMALFGLLAATVIGIAAVVAGFFPAVFEIGEYPVRLLRWVVVLSGARVAAELLGQVFDAGLVARNRFGLRNAAMISQLLLGAALSIAVIVRGGGLIEIAAAGLVVAALYSAALFALAVRVGLPVPRRSYISRQAGRTLFGFGLLSLTIQFVRRFSLFGGSLVLGVMLGPVAVAFYSVAESLTRRCETFGKPLNMIVMPYASQFAAQADRFGLKRLLILPTRMLTVCGLLVTGLLVVMGKPFLTLWIGPQVVAGAFPVLAVLSLSLLIKLPSNGIQSLLEGTGDMRFLSRVAIGEGLTMLVLAVAFVPAWGAIGMAWAVVAAQGVFSGLLLPVYVCHKLGLSTAQFVAQSVGPALLSVAPAVGLAVYFVRALPVDSLLLLLLQMSAVTAAAGMATLLFCMDAAARRDIWQSFLGRRGKASRHAANAASAAGAAAPGPDASPIRTGNSPA